MPLFKFRSFLPDENWDEFDKACDDYYYPDKSQKKPGYGYTYAAIPDEKKAREFAKKNIKCLHKFIDPQFVFGGNANV